MFKNRRSFGGTGQASQSQGKSAGQSSGGQSSSSGGGRGYGSRDGGGRSEGRGYGGGRSGGGRTGGGRGFGGRGGRSGGGGRGGRGFGGGGGRFAMTSIPVDKLINKVNEEAFIKPTEHVIKHQFKDFPIQPKLLQNITQKGYISPTPIQDQSIPLVLEGRDVIGLANTGTGKTAAFLLPLINKILLDRTQKVIILTPTRELAVQIQEELRGFTPGMNIGSVLCIGGSSMYAQQKAIRMPFNFLIGTPGRVMDLYKRKMLHLDRFQNAVLDEADRMLDMGFINDIKFIMGLLPKVRQTLFYTATFDSTIEKLTEQFLNNPIKVSVKTRDTSANIEQDIVHVPADFSAKIQILKELLAKPGFDKVLVFGRTKHGVRKISERLEMAGIKADSIHGDKSQNYRLRALREFKSGFLKVLVATDVAARGLDISGVSHVINFDIPATYDDYVHRIGRTGRADKKGVALTFVTQR